MDSARKEAETMLSDSRENAHRLSSEAERRHRDELVRLENQRDQVRGELSALSGLLDAERTRLAEALGAALRFVERTLTPAKDVSELRPVPSITGAPATDGPAPDGPAPDDLEAQISEDAAAAAPLLPATESSPAPGETEVAGAETEGGRANLAAVPSLDESGPDTEAWHFPQATADTGVRRLGSAASSDWTA
jgi:transposase